METFKTSMCLYKVISRRFCWFHYKMKRKKMADTWVLFFVLVITIMLLSSVTVLSEHESYILRWVSYLQRNPGHRSRNIYKTKYPISIYVPYLINNPSVCSSSEKVDVLMIVHSAPANFVRRNVIRQTWGSLKSILGVKFKLVFILGQTDNPRRQTLIENENVINRDVIQGMFKDTYQNLTNKAVLGLRWIAEFCPNSTHVLKLDDDVFLDIFKFVNAFLPQFSLKTRSIACTYRTDSSVQRHGKWEVNEDEFKNLTEYPFGHCNGFVVLMTSDLILPMFQASHFSPFLWLDDVYVTGILALAVGNVSHIDIRANLTIDIEWGKTCFKEVLKPCPLLATTVQFPRELRTLWGYSLLRSLSRSMLLSLSPSEAGKYKHAFE